MIEFDIQVATVTTFGLHSAETEGLVMQAARGRPVNDNTDREQRLAEIEDTLVRYGVLQPGARILMAEPISF